MFCKEHTIGSHLPAVKLIGAMAETPSMEELRPAGDGPKAARIDVLGCPFDVVDFEQAAAIIRAAALDDRQLHVVTANVDFIMKAKRDPAFARELADADLVVADGVPVLWAAKLLGRPLMGRVNGTDMVERCATMSAREGIGIALVGGGPGVAEKAATAMCTRHPGARITAVPTPARMENGDSGELARAVRETDSAIVLVALGAPRQERWLRRHLADTGCAVGIGVGSALDILAGDRSRAPRVLREHGFEWLHRLALEPGRLGRRYLVEDSPFVFYLAAAVTRRYLGPPRRSA